MTIRPAIATWSAKDVLNNIQINSLQSYCLDSPSLNIYSNNYSTANTFSGNITIGTAHSQTNSFQILAMNSVYDMVNLPSPVDGQIICLSDTSGTIGFPNEFFRYDLQDSITETYSPAYLTNTGYEYYSAKPTSGIGCWKLINYPTIPKISYYSTCANPMTSSFGSSIAPLPVYTLWTSSGGFALSSIPANNVSLPNNFIFTTNKITATGMGFSVIPKATNYYICDVEYNFPIIQLGTLNVNNYLFATLYAINSQGSAQTYYAGGIGQSSLSCSNTGSWTTCAQPWYTGSSTSNYQQFVYLKKRIVVQSAIGSDDTISFGLGLAGSTTGLYAQMGGSIGLYQSSTITIQAY